jgi:hypothetical protein
VVRAVDSLPALSLGFEPNRGQADPQVKFVSRHPGYSVCLLSQEAVFVLSKADANVATEGDSHDAMLGAERMRRQTKQTVLRLKLIHSNPNPRVVCTEELPGFANWFVGKDPEKWLSHIPTYGRITFLEVYPGIDLVYHGNRHQLEFDFIVQPGANPGAISLAMEGADSLEVAPDGALVLQAGMEQVRLGKPLLQQQSAGPRKEVSGGYLVGPGRQVRFHIGGYDVSRPLVIDPVLTYSTYLGGSLDDEPAGITVDANGNAYVVGTTGSTDFPASLSAPPVSGGGTGVFVSKLNASGSALIYSTYLGGSGTNFGRGIAVDAAGNAYVVGSTDSTNFPVTSGAFGRTPQGLFDVFVAKLNPEGSALLYATLLGGTGNDAGRCIALDADGNACVAGATSSNRVPFPTTSGAFDTNRHLNSDVFVTKLNADGSALIYSTLLGGDGSDIAYGIAVDAAGAAYVTGATASTNFPTTPEAFATTHQGNSDAFVAKLSADGTSVLYSTLLGGSASATYMEGDVGLGIAVDPQGAAYVTGYSDSTNFPTTPGAWKPSKDGGSSSRNAFVTKIAADGSTLVYSTLLGGSAYAAGRAIAFDFEGTAYVTGETYSRDFPVTPGAFDPIGNDSKLFDTDGFLTRLNTNGSALLYSTYLAGNSADIGRGIAVDTDGSVYITGSTYSSDFPTTRDSFTGSADYVPAKSDAFVLKLVPLPVPMIVSGPTTIPNSALVNQPFLFSVLATNTVPGPLSYAWDFGDGQTASGNLVSHAYDIVGQYAVAVTVSEAGAGREAGVAVMVRDPNSASGSLKFSESYAVRRKVECFGHGIFSPCLSSKSIAGSFRITGTVSLRNLDLTRVDASTPIRFRVGGFAFAGRLGDDPGYLPGAGKAHLVLRWNVGSVVSPEAAPYLTVALRWNAQTLRVTLSGKVAAGAHPIVASTWAGHPSGVFQPVLPASLEFGGASVNFEVTNKVHVSASARVLTTDDYNIFRPSVVRASGKGQGAAGQ